MFKFSGSKLSDFDSLLPKQEPIRFQKLDPEIIALICDELQWGAYLALDRQWRTNDHLACRKGLLSLAVAAKAFMDPALNALWHVLSTVDPLLSVLPETTVVDGKKMLVRPIAPPSWERLRFYTSRVHRFDQRFLSEAEESTIHESVYARLGQTESIFPSLKEFHPTNLISCSNSLVFFLTPTTVTASLPTLLPSTESQPDEATDFGPSLALLAWKAPQIQTLHLDAQARYSGFSACVSCFSDLEELRVARLSRYDPDFMSGIASLTKLSSLNLTLPPKSSLNFKGITASGFNSVKKLRISGSPGELHQLLKFMPPLVLDELRMTFNLYSASWQENRHDMLTLTRSLERFSSLSAIDIASISEWDMTRLDGQFLWALFGPLLKLRRLRQISYDLPLYLTDQKTAEIANAWPELETLTLTSETWGDGIPSIASLASFVRSCPNMTSLEYPIRVNFPAAAPGTSTPTTSTGIGGLLPYPTTPYPSTPYSSSAAPTPFSTHPTPRTGLAPHAPSCPSPLPPNPPPPPPTLKKHPMEKFRCILYDDVKDPAVVALHLYQIFPGLKWADGPGRRWNEVQAILDTFHFLSRQNRRIEE